MKLKQMMGNRLSDISSASLSIENKYDNFFYFEQSSQFLRMIKITETSIGFQPRAVEFVLLFLNILFSGEYV